MSQSATEVMLRGTTWRRWQNACFDGTPTIPKKRICIAGHADFQEKEEKGSNRLFEIRFDPINFSARACPIIEPIE